MSSEELIREASNPATAPARLAELASADRATWPALASNPSTYDGLLGWLSERNDPAVNAALTARAQASLPPVPPAPPAPPAPAPVEAVAPAAPFEAAAPAEPFQAAEPEEPTVVAPAAPIFEAPAQPEPTAVFAAPVAEPTAVFQTPGAPEPVAAYPSAPAAASTTPPAGGDNGGKNLAIVVAMVAVVIALIAGAAYGATQVFGGDDEVKTSAPADSKKSDAPATDEDDDSSSTLPTPDSSDDDSTGASSEFCSTMKDVQDASTDLVGRVGDSPDLDDIKQMGEDMVQSYRDLADAAPAELRTDIEAMGSYFEIMTNPTADGASSMSESFSDYMDSAQRVSTYYSKNCF